MKKKAKSRAAVPKVDPYIDGFMTKLVERLIRLESKVDKILFQTGRSSGNGAPAPQAAPPPRRERMLYEAICADCSKVCEVPFQPSEARPVYCKECWARRKGGQGRGPSGMPVLRPVALPPKPASKLSAAAQAAALANAKPQKTKKSKPAKKAKKKK